MTKPLTPLLTRLLGRLPIGWLQLMHNKTRLVAAIAGVTFANVLVLMQLGFMGALFESNRKPYRAMNADILLYSPLTNTLADAERLPRQRLFDALAVPGVADATPLYIGAMDWDREDGIISAMRVYGIDPDAAPFTDPAIRNHATDLKLLDTLIVDSKTRNPPAYALEQIKRDGAYQFEGNDRALTLTGTFEMGAGFDADGFMVASEETFMNLFPQRRVGAPNYILVTIEKDADLATVVAALRKALPAIDTVVDTKDAAALIDQDYQTTERPIGLVFGFSVVIGLLVGMIIVYQVLSTDVADHMAEYATMKAMGYRHAFFAGIVLEEAIILAVLGFIPGITISTTLYHLASGATGLPIQMDATRAVAVFAGTVVMCTASGVLATRRLAKADPADLF